jgi:hypothetical protein
MSEHKNGLAQLAELAALAANVPQERRRAIESELRFPGNPKQDAAFAAGLAQASEFAARQSAEAAQPLCEIAAVAAAHVLYLEREYARVREQAMSPDFRAQLEAEAELIRAGKVTPIRAEEVIRELNEREEKSRGEPRNGD